MDEVGQQVSDLIPFAPSLGDFLASCPHSGDNRLLNRMDVRPGAPAVLV